MRLLGGSSFWCMQAACAVLLFVLPITSVLRAQVENLVEASPDAVDFGKVIVGSSESRAIKLNNVSDFLVYVSAIRLSEEGTDFTLGHGGGFYLQAGESTPLSMSFQPETSGEQTATVQIEADAVIIGKQEGSEEVLNPSKGAEVTETETVALAGTGVQPAEIEVAPTEMDFGDVRVDDSESQSISISNIGETTLVIYSADISGENSFSVSPTDSFSVAPGAEKFLTVTFNPDDEGGQEASLIIVSNDSDQPELSIPLTGDGIIAGDIDLSTSRLEFGEVPVGQSDTLDITITNDGRADLTIDEMRIRGSDAFGVQERAPVTLDPDEAIRVEVTFSPTQSGAHEATLYIESDDPTGREERLILEGVGVAPAISVSPDTLHFEDVRIGETDALELRIINEGKAVLDITRIDVDESTGFTVHPIHPLEVLPGKDTVMTVTFAPAVPGDRTATLTIEGNAPNQPVVEVSLVGRGTGPKIVTSPEVVEIERTLVGWRSIGSLRISNSGTHDLNLTTVTLTGSHPENFQIGSLERTTLAPGRETTVDVIFRPTSAGDKEAVVEVQSNDPTAEVAAISVVGTAVEMENRSSAAAPEETGPEIVVEVPDGVASPPAGTIYFRKTGERTYQSGTLQSEENLFTANLPPEYVSMRGVDYYLEFTDGEHTVTVPSRRPDRNPLQLRVRVQRAVPPITMEGSTYRMISIPLELRNASVESVLQDDYETYDERAWRLFRWKDTAYVEFPRLQESFEPGKAFWLISRAGEPFDVDSARSSDGRQPFAIDLQPGWNQIGNPFAFPVSWDSVESDGTVGPPVYYDGSELRYDRDPRTLQPWEGYFVYNGEDAPVTVKIPPVEASTPERVSKKEPFGRVLAGKHGYVIQLLAHIPDSPWKDTQNWVGFVAGPGTEAVPTVMPEPPAVKSNLRLSIVQEDKEYAAAVTEGDPGGARWELKLSRAEIERELDGDEEVTIELREYGKQRHDFGLHVFDHDRRQSVAIDDGTLHISFPNQTSVKHLSLLLGSSAFVRSQRDSLLAVPDRYVLEDNYPNPFNPTTVIPYRLSHRTRVVLEIFDTLGRRVRRLVEAEQDPGRYEVRWNGRDGSGRLVSSGVYLYRIRAGEFTATEKALLLR